VLRAEVGLVTGACATIARFDPEYKRLCTVTAGEVQVINNASDKKVQETAAIVLTTIGADADGAALARALVEDRLAACVSVLPPMSSTYRWKGTVETEREQQLLIKTTVDRVEVIQARLRTLHPYELPEFVVLTATASAVYAAWLAESTRPPA
jgi:periplasmic divalent cation tolerance protein